MGKKILVISVCLAILGCMSRRIRSHSYDSVTSKPISFEVITEGSYSGYSEPAQLWITDQAAWEQCWKNIYRDTSPVPALPSIDFAQKQIIACFMGNQNRGGFSVDIDQIQRLGDTLQVDVQHIVPGEACIATMAIVQPYQVVGIPIVERVEKIKFKTDTIVNDC